MSRYPGVFPSPIGHACLLWEVPVAPLTEADVDRAVRVVAGHARDAVDLLDLLGVLGLHEADGGQVMSIDDTDELYVVAEGTVVDPLRAEALRCAVALITGRLYRTDRIDEDDAEEALILAERFHNWLRAEPGA